MPHSFGVKKWGKRRWYSVTSCGGADYIMKTFAIVVRSDEQGNFISMFQLDPAHWPPRVYPLREHSEHMKGDAA